MTARLRPGPQGVEWQHGTHSGYHNHKCRCEPCRDASRKHQAVPRSIYLARVHAKAQEINHGTAHAYNRGCRCDACRAANTAHAQRVRDAAAAKRGRGA